MIKPLDLAILPPVSHTTDTLRYPPTIHPTHHRDCHHMAFVSHTPLPRATAKCRTETSPRRRRTMSTAVSTTMELPIGTKVRVKAKIEMFHYPNHRNEAFDVSGLEGVVSTYLIDKWGKASTATKPYQVKFEDPKFMAHFDEDELEVIE